jgi:hypothetical protein
MGQKTRRESLNMFSCLEDFVEISDTGIDQCIKEHLVNQQFRFLKCFPEAGSDKYKCITDPFHADSLQNKDFSLEE